MPRPLRTTLTLLLAAALGVPASPAPARTAGATDTPPSPAIAPVGDGSGLPAHFAAAWERLRRFDGSPGAVRATWRAWRQLLHDAGLVSGTPDRWGAPEQLRRQALAEAAADVIPVAVLDLAWTQDGLFAAAAMRERTWRGAEVRFDLDPANWLSLGRAPLAKLEADFGDGGGWRRIGFGVPAVARYATTGTRTVRLRAHYGDGTSALAAFALEVEALTTPVPSDTLEITGAAPYLGVTGTARGYVHLAPGHSALTNPIVVIEGFDLDNNQDWDPLYALLNQESLVERLAGRGYDLVVVDFADATDHLQRNAYVVAGAIQQVEALVGSNPGVALVGASMGGLLGRHALAWMEFQGMTHGVRTFVSFDAPHQGADIPLGIQYWTRFFAPLSADAAHLLERLGRPAARQMLVYLSTDPPSPAAAADPLRAQYLADLAAAGDWPAQPRLVGFANGSGHAQGQGFAAGEQIVRWEYDSFLVRIRGNVWAVPDGGPAQVFSGRTYILFVQDTQQNVSVSGSLPYDNSPGGWRATMAQMDSVAAPYGDIVALHQRHSFIPTVSALALSGVGLFHDVAADPQLMSRTPFDTVYWAPDNQEHVSITAGTADRLIAELAPGALAVEPGGPRTGVHAQLIPNPFREAARVRFTLAAAGRAEVEVIGADGRRLVTLLDEHLPAGGHEAAWDGHDAQGRRAAPGLYFVRVKTPGALETRRIALVR